MSKKIIAVALLVLAVTVLFAACKKEEYEVSHTIQVGTTTVDVYQDSEGNEFVTNVDGDMIPMTTDAEGFYENIEDLFTETTTKKNKNDKTTTTTTKPSTTTTTTTEPASGETPSQNSTTTTTTTTTTNTTTTTEKVDIQVGSGNTKEDIIKWEDIRDA